MCNECSHLKYFSLYPLDLLLSRRFRQTKRSPAARFPAYTLQANTNSFTPLSHPTHPLGPFSLDTAPLVSGQSAYLDTALQGFIVVFGRVWVPLPNHPLELDLK